MANTERTGFYAPLGVLRSAPGGRYGAVVRTLRLIKLERPDIWTLVIYAVAIGLMSLIVPLATQTLVNTLAFTALAQPILVLSVLVFVGLSVASFMRAAQTVVVERLQERLLAKAAIDVGLRLVRATEEAFASETAAMRMFRFLEITTVQKSVAILVMDGLSVVLQSAVGLVLVSFYHPALFLYALFCLVSMGVVVITMGRKGPETAIHESHAKYEVVHALEHLISARQASPEPDECHLVEEVDGAVVHYVEARREHFHVVYRQTLASLAIQVVATVGLLALGGTLVLKAQLSLGQLMASELVMASTLANFSKFGKYLETYYDLTASMDKLGVVLDLEAKP